MAGNALLIKGSKLYVGDGAGDFEEIGGVRAISDLDGGTNDTVEDTRIDSLGKEWVIGFLDAGEPTIELTRDYADVGQQRLKALRDSGAIETFVLVLPASVGAIRYIHWSAGVTALPSNFAPSDIRVTGGATLRTSGVVEYDTVDPMA